LGPTRGLLGGQPAEPGGLKTREEFLIEKEPEARVGSLNPSRATACNVEEFPIKRNGCFW